MVSHKRPRYSHKRSYAAGHRRASSRKVDSSTIGTHVQQRRGAPVRRSNDFADTIRRRARMRRFIAGAVALIIIVGAALLMGVLTFRGTVGSSMALKNSNAGEALKTANVGEPYNVLISAELGATAAPLESEGPDSLILARVDNENERLALINIPSNLQVSKDGRTTDVAQLAKEGDAAVIEAVSSFIKLPISHYVKIDEEGIVELVDGLGGLEIDIDQVIDDPHAGDMYLPAGPYELKGQTALLYLRADNLKLGMQDKLAHQLKFTAQVLEEIFGTGAFATKIDSIDHSFQTDFSLADLEAVAKWFNGKNASDIVVTTLPGYTSAITSVDASDKTRFIGSYDSFVSLIETLDKGERPPTNNTDGIEAASPSTFTVDIQNGTTITGAASVTADQLREDGFRVGETGNAEQQVYEETLVIYNGNEGLGQAKAVMEALGVGRPVEGGDYYTFSGDILVIIGSDYSPIN